MTWQQHDLALPLVDCRVPSVAQLAAELCRSQQRPACAAAPLTGVVMQH
jgi:hypothetical protein